MPSNDADAGAEAVEPHGTQIVVWDEPPAIESNATFNVKLGVKCDSECRVDGWAVEIRDHDGKIQGMAALSDEPWTGTSALYYAELALIAPGNEGLYAWEARVAATDGETPHAESAANFSVRVVPAPECVVTVVAVDKQSQTPIEGAKVVAHPYRTVTDEQGVAAVKVPKGDYRVFVSGKNYLPYRSDSAVEADVTIKAELVLDEGPSDAELWS